MKGYKTYAVCVVAVVYAISGFFSGAFDANAMVQMILAALAAAGLRNAIG